MNTATMRYLGAAAAWASAILYYLIGFGVLDIGEAKDGAATDLLGFGLVTGTSFLVAGALVLLVHRRWLIALIGLLDLAVIIGYFAVSGVREPPYEVWGLTIKGLQVVLLLVIGFLTLKADAWPRHDQAILR
jgi:hypothetical protein